MLTVADTAYAIARLRADEATLPPEERLFEDPYAAVFADAGAHAAEGVERFLALPFFREGVRLRTRFFDDFVRAGLDAGITQLVLLGAGFDARGLRMREVRDRGARVWEVDFEAQLATKVRLLAAAGHAPPERVSYVPCDFNADDFEGALTAGLAAAGFRLGAGALFVWEGVVAYLDAPRIARTMRFMASAGGPGTRAAFDFSESHFDDETCAQRALRTGFTASDELGYDALWRSHMKGEPPAAAALCRVAVVRV